MPEHADQDEAEMHKLFHSRSWMLLRDFYYGGAIAKQERETVMRLLTLVWRTLDKNRTRKGHYLNAVGNAVTSVITVAQMSNLHCRDVNIADFNGTIEALALREWKNTDPNLRYHKLDQWVTTIENEGHDSWVDIVVIADRLGEAIKPDPVKVLG